MKTAALALAKRGFKVFPVAEGAKKPPLISEWPAHATLQLGQIDTWWAGSVANANIGIHCEGMLVIDVDVKSGGDESLEALIDLGLNIGTLTTRTPTGGRHLFYKLPEGHPGVPNSVSSIGAGLDVRSTGGYVIAPGSTIGGERYHFEADVPILPAPLGLVQELGLSTKREHPEIVNVPDAPDVVVERARAWLEGQGGAVEGEGGDAYTYGVACGLRDRGVAKHQALLLMDTWNERCSPPWDSAELTTKVRNAYSYASGAPGGKVALPDDFPLLARPGETIDSETGEISSNVSVLGRTLKQGPLSLAEFADQPRRRGGYIIKGLLQRGSYAEVYGAPGVGKTFAVLDMAYHVAAGLDWMERKVHDGAVLYVAFEGTGGLVARAQALRQHYGVRDVPLYVLPGNFNLRELAGRAELGSYIRELPAKPSLIIFDTFAHALMGGDENSAQDVSAFNRGVQALINSTDACVLIVHHSGKDKAKGARGSSALLAALDTEIEVDTGQITATKQRDVELGAPIGFKLLPMAVDMDDDGDAITSCVVEPSKIAAGGMSAALKPHSNAKRAWDVLCDVKPNNEPIAGPDWHRACAFFLPPSLAGSRKAFHDAVAVLRHNGMVVAADDDMYQRRMT